LLLPARELAEIRSSKKMFFLRAPASGVQLLLREQEKPVSFPPPVMIRHGNHIATNLVKTLFGVIFHDLAAARHDARPSTTRPRGCACSTNAAVSLSDFLVSGG
jgi:hypothetical protein